MFLGLLSYGEGGDTGGTPTPTPTPTPLPEPVLQTAGRGADHAFRLRKHEAEEACLLAIAAFLTSIER